MTHRVTRELDALLAELSDGAGTRSREFADALHRDVPELGDDPVVREISRASIEANVRALLALVRSGDSLDDYQLPGPAAEFARQLVRRGVPLDPLLRTLRLGTEWMWHTWSERLDARVADPRVRADLLKHCMDATLAYMDHLSAHITDAYHHEYERWARSAAAVRLDTVRGLVAGDDDADVAVAERRLGYRIAHRHHLGLILWLAHPADDHADGPESHLRAIAPDLHVTSTLVVPVAHGSSWVWRGAETPIDESRVAETARRLHIETLGVALGTSGRGVDGFRRTHREAEQARRVLTARHGAGIARYHELVIEALTMADASARRTFVDAELGPLAAAHPTEARLRSTLLVHLDAGSRARVTAQRLGVHENTIHHRLRRAEEILGRPLTHRRLELHLALRLFETLPIRPDLDVAQRPR